jgi:hypothetical protein
MIDLKCPERIRIISEVAGRGTTVHSDLTQSQKEAKFVLQAALGISGSQSYLLSERNLVVEGVDDYWIICELSNILRRSGEASLPDDVFVTPAGGASEAAYIATFMIGQKLEVAVLLDSDGAGEEAHDKLVKTWLSCYQEKKANVLLLGDVVGSTAEAFAIEDLFTEEYFLNVVRNAYKKELAIAGSPALAPLPEGTLLWKRVSRALVTLGIPYDSEHKGRVAKALRSALLTTKTISDLPEKTQEMARKLIAKLREIFPPAEGALSVNDEPEPKKSRKRKEAAP